MKFKRSQVEDIHINLTPMIDCLLFILVFLLLSTSFNQFSRMNLTLPEAQGVPPKAYDQKVEVVVDASGHYSVNGQALSSKEVADLNTAIKQISNDRRDLRSEEHTSELQSRPQLVSRPLLDKKNDSLL